MKPINPTTEDEARNEAIDWQSWHQDQAMSYGELAEWQAHFTETGEQFNLTEEFKENGII